MEKEERKEKIAELRKFHEKTFEVLGVPDGYFAAKMAHYAEEGDTVKVIGLYPSEVQKGDPVYVEFCTYDYKPVDSQRRLYVWHPQEKELDRYRMKKGQYLIPVEELRSIAWEGAVECRLPVEGKVFSDTTAFSIIETTQVVNKTVKYKGPRNGVEFEVEYKNDKLKSLRYKDSKLPGGYQGFSMSDSMLIDVIDFIKQLK